MELQIFVSAQLTAHLTAIRSALQNRLILVFRILLLQSLAQLDAGDQLRLINEVVNYFNKEHKANRLTADLIDFICQFVYLLFTVENKLNYIYKVLIFIQLKQIISNNQIFVNIRYEMIGYINNMIIAMIIKYRHDNTEQLTCLELLKKHCIDGLVVPNEPLIVLHAIQFQTTIPLQDVNNLVFMFCALHNIRNILNPNNIIVCSIGNSVFQLHITTVDNYTNISYTQIRG